MANIILSLIIPIYNSEKYIVKCLNSVINQLTSECEIIIIDDGSTDNSIKIINDLFNKFIENNLLKLINIENNGPGYARNKGVELSKGIYIGFIDSDDIVYNNYIERILYCIKNTNSDIIQFNYKIFYENYLCKSLKIKFMHNSFGDFELDNVRHEIFGIGKWFPWARTFRREILTKYPFPVGVFYEDTLCIPFIFLNSFRISLLDNCLYGYRINPLSTTSNHKIEHRDTLFIFFNYLIKHQDSISINILKIQTARGLSYFSAEFKDNYFISNEIPFKINLINNKYRLWKYLCFADRLFLINPRIYHLIDRIRLYFIFNYRK